MAEGRDRRIPVVESTRSHHAALTGFNQVFESQYVTLVRMVALVAGSRAVAEEVVQDAFAELHRRWDRIENPEAYVRVVAVNGARRVAKRGSVERKLIGSAAADSRGRVVELDVGRSEFGPVMAALQRLSERQRAAVVLRYFDDASEAEIAAILKCRPGTVKSLLARSMPVLRSLLAELDPTNRSSEDVPALAAKWDDPRRNLGLAAPHEGTPE